MIPPIVKHHSLFLSTQRDNEEKSKARKIGRLPDNLTPYLRDSQVPETANAQTAIAYLLTDVLYQILFELCEQMQKHGLDLKFEAKRRFNDLFRTAKAFRAAASKANEAVFTLREQDIDNYFNDVIWLREIIELLYDRSMGTTDAHDRIKALLFNLPSPQK